MFILEPQIQAEYKKDALESVDDQENEIRDVKVIHYTRINQKVKNIVFDFISFKF